jgi:ABC-2 type transport system ATP-binding protein
MNSINVEQVSKHFKVLNRREGLVGACKDLFSQNYKIIKAVDAVSMNIAQGEIVGFVGPNGAGKSTTIKMLTGVLEPTGGSITVNGFNPLKQRKKYIQHVGVVFGQRTQLWWDIPVIESFKLLKEMYRISTSVYEKNLGLFNELVDLKSLYLKPVRTLSLGQRMLCDITAAFLHDPAIIFLDEPTVGLDVSVKSKMRTLISNLNTIKKTTILLTSHDINDIEKLCKRIIIIDKGSIIYDGEVARFNRAFGSFRTLRINIDTTEEIVVEIEKTIQAKMPATGPVVTFQKESDWIDITINQDEVSLLSVLELILKEYPVKDIKIIEISLENIIQKVYEGTLYEKISQFN